LIKEKHIPDEELPVVLFIAGRAHVAPATVIDLRLSGKTWMDISPYFGLSAFPVTAENVFVNLKV
jgi:hypothetical protein